MTVEVRRARLVLAYDGAAFHGFAKSPLVTSVAATLEAALSTISRMPVKAVGAGRTDTGVHAWGQVVHADLPADTDLEGVRRRINKMCAPSLAVRSAEWAPSENFHARFDALWRHYRYTVYNSPTPSPFLTTTAWHVTHPLNLKLMQLACDPLIGEHDMSSFCRKPKQPEGATPKSLVRRTLSAAWTDLGDGLLRFDIRATAFCHQQVRSITGTLVEVGLGKRTAGDIAAMLRARKRDASCQVAPPAGLCLWEVGYQA